MNADVFIKGSLKSKGGLLSIRLFIFILMAAFALSACSGSGADNEPEGYLTRDSEELDKSVPLVSLRHWRESTPNERYSFLIGFVSMLELEKEWQGKKAGRLLPREQSLVGSWVLGFENRPLREIYKGLNQYLENKPGDIERPVVEIMWFLFVQPRLEEKTDN